MRKRNRQQIVTLRAIYAYHGEMDAADSGRPLTGRRRRTYPSNAARQAAYRRRVAARDAAFKAAVDGTFATAVDQIEALAARRVAEARAERDEHRRRREQAERASVSAATRLARIEVALARTTDERDQARREVRSARVAFRKERAGLEEGHRRELDELRHELAVLALDFERQRAAGEFVDQPERSVGLPRAIRGDVAGEVGAPTNRAQRRATRRGKRQGRR